MNKVTSTRRVKKYNVILKKKGGNLIAGIRLNPQSNESLNFIKTQKDWSSTKTINNALMFARKYYHLFEKETQEEK